MLVPAALWLADYTQNPERFREDFVGRFGCHVDFIFPIDSCTLDHRLIPSDCRIGILPTFISNEDPPLQLRRIRNKQCQNMQSYFGQGGWNLLNPMIPKVIDENVGIAVPQIIPNDGDEVFECHRFFILALIAPIPLEVKLTEPPEVEPGPPQNRTKLGGESGFAASRRTANDDQSGHDEPPIAGTGVTDEFPRRATRRAKPTPEEQGTLYATSAGPWQWSVIGS